MIARRIVVQANSAGTVNVTHGLGYMPTYWAVERHQASTAFSASVVGGTVTKTALQMHFSGAGTVVLAVA